MGQSFTAGATVFTIGLGAIRRHAGIAGAYSYSVPVTYTVDGITEPTRVVSFHGSRFGNPGPVCMITPECPGGLFVTDPGRFGSTLTSGWVRRFFGAE